jgi:hypothetical protein
MLTGNAVCGGTAGTGTGFVALSVFGAGGFGSAIVPHAYSRSQQQGDEYGV